MKRIKILITLFVLVVILSGCGNKKINYEKHLISFSYSYGNKDMGFNSYYISDDGSKVNYSLTSTSNSVRNINKEIDKEYIKRITNIIDKYDVLDWDGFNKHKEEESNKIVFSIELGYDNGDNYSASGYMKYPDNFDKVHSEFIKIFNELYN